ncbi:MAG: GMC family oxidoreductase [Deltaproteobacteria bacterium]|nr:GMC family oxidoreductase [Deltaproteobacteria bacterium]
MIETFDVCVIGSGAGGGPVALTVAEAGFSVVVLEKGPWFKEGDFFKDDLASSYRSVFTPNLKDEPHVIEESSGDEWSSASSGESGKSFWNGNCVGGSSNFMSGFFHRLKPYDFTQASSFAPIPGANIVDWPISYDDLEPYYAKVEKEVGISGRVVDHPQAEPRSTKNFPYPPTVEHPISKQFDDACQALDLHAIPVARAILPYSDQNRKACSYSGFCGGYGCASGAKGSSRAALLDKAVATGRCTIRPHAKVFHLESDETGKVTVAKYYNSLKEEQQIRARIFVVACQAIETSRLLLLSTGPRHPKGIGNRFDQVGKNLLFSTFAFGSGLFPFEHLSEKEAQDLKRQGPFVNRSLQDWYILKDVETGEAKKGGTIDFLFAHPDPIATANAVKWGPEGLVWGKALQKRLHAVFTKSRRFVFEVFGDWLPNDDCFVSLDPLVKDAWGLPVAKVRVGNHPHAWEIAGFLARRAEEVLTQMGAIGVSSSVNVYPPTNLQAGGCRFGKDPSTSVLNADCRVHDAENLFVSDGSFMPTGGSVPYTWTIYANSFRVADKVVDQLREIKSS